MSQRYCKEPFDLPGEVGSYPPRGTSKMTIAYETALPVTDGWVGCGLWRSRATGETHELATSNQFYYYICKRCLQQDGLLW